MTVTDFAQQRVSAAGATLHLVKTIAQSSPWLFALTAVLTVTRAAATAGYVIGATALVQRLDDSTSIEFGMMALTIGCWTLTQVLENAMGMVTPSLQSAWTVSLTRRVLSFARQPAVTPDRTQRRNAAQAVMGEIRGWMGLDCIRSVWSAVDSRLIGLVGVAFVAWWSPLAALLVAGAHLASSAVFTRYLDVVHRDLAAVDTLERRRTQYVRDLLLEPSAAKEVRLFGLSGWLVERYHREWSRSIVDIWARRRAAVRPSLWALLAFAAIALTTVLMLGWSVAHGSIGVSKAAAVIQGMILSSGLGMLGDTLVQVGRAKVIASSVVDLEQRGSSTQECCAACAVDDDDRAWDVEAKELTFRYPGQQRPTLQGLTFAIREGERVAVVGLNGAGKSTIVRLIAGLETSDGAMRVGGVAPESLCARHRPAVVFQRFAHLPTSLHANIDMRHQDEDAYVRAERDSGVDRLRVGRETRLSSTMRGGTDLSGGEWQRVALARGLAAIERGARVLVLDEPTSALDIRIEREIFDSLLRHRGRTTTVLVTHRLASARRADRILVVSDGRIAEAGCHDELMAQGGVYAGMFTSQAAMYQSVTTSVSESIS